MCEIITAISSTRDNAWQGHGQCRTQAAALSLPRALAAAMAAAAAPWPLVWLGAPAEETGKNPSDGHRHRISYTCLYAFVGREGAFAVAHM